MDINGQAAGTHLVAGKVFHVSGCRCETLGEVGKALAAECGFAGGAGFDVGPDEITEEPAGDMTGLLVFGWSQWVASEEVSEMNPRASLERTDSVREASFPWCRVNPKVPILRCTFVPA